MAKTGNLMPPPPPPPPYEPMFLDEPMFLAMRVESLPELPQDDPGNDEAQR